MPEISGNVTRLKKNGEKPAVSIGKMDELLL